MTTNTPTTPLDAARHDLAEREEQAGDDDGHGNAVDWRERSVLEPLVDVADMTCRIGDHRDSAHYRAEKSGELVRAAMRTRAACFERYAGADDEDDPRAEALSVLEDLAVEIDKAIALGRWTIAKASSELYVSDAAVIRRTAREFADWAARLAETAVPDPED